jgi:hypothetical protein
LRPFGFAAIPFPFSFLHFTLSHQKSPVTIAENGKSAKHATLTEVIDEKKLIPTGYQLINNRHYLYSAALL